MKATDEDLRIVDEWVMQTNPQRGSYAALKGVAVSVVARDANGIMRVNVYRTSEELNRDDWPQECIVQRTYRVNGLQIKNDAQVGPTTHNKNNY